MLLGNRGGLILMLAVLVALCGWFGLRQYGNARVATAQVEVAKEAISSAVERRDEAVKADAQTRAKRAATVQDVRAQAISVEKSNAQVCLDADVGVDARGMWNDLIHNANRAIAESRGVP